MELVGGGMLTITLCLVGLLGLAALIGGGLVLLKLGVIGSYWLKGQDFDEGEGDYRLDQSHGS